MPRILIIRPKFRAKADMQTCTDAGWLAVPFSPIEIEVDEGALRRLPERFKQADAVFWVSPTAIETAAPHLDFSDGLKKQITVGQASRKILAAFCHHEIYSPSSGNDSEAVLRLPLWKEMPKGSSVLIVRGHGGRDLLASELRRKGFKVSFAEIYFRRPNSLNWHDFNPHSIKAAYVASGELAQALFRQVPSQFSLFFKSLLYFTHHPRIADTLRLAGAENVRVIQQFDAAVLNEAANEPDTADIVASRNPPPEKNGEQSNKVAAERPDSDKENTAALDKRDTVPTSETFAATSENDAGPSEKQAAGEITGNTMSEPKQIPQTSANPVVIRQSSGKGLAAGALVLALLGLGASGFLFVEGQNVLKNQQLEFSQKLDKAALGESENAVLLKENINRQTVIQSELERLGSGQKANAEQIVLTQKAYQELAKGRANWLADEAETLLNQASQQLVLSGNVQGAISVLEHVHNRLSRFDQPELLAIKQAVSSDLASLKNHPYVDISGTALRIDRLETAVAGLPLLIDGTLKPSKNENSRSPNPNLSWWENAWEKSLDALKGLVEVRRLDNNDAMLIAPDQVYFVRENLRLRLLDARTALMQHNSEVYQSDLNNAEAAVRQYFDSNSPATRSWLKELADLKSLDIRPVAEDALQSSRAAVYAYQEGIRGQAPEMPLIAAPSIITPAPAQSAAPVATPAVPALPSENRAASAAGQQAVPEANGPASAAQPKPQIPKAPAAIKRPQVPVVPAKPAPATPKAPAADQPPMRDFINRNPPAQTDPTPSADTSSRGDQA